MMGVSHRRLSERCSYLGLKRKDKRSGENRAKEIAIQAVFTRTMQRIMAGDM